MQYSFTKYAIALLPAAGSCERVPAAGIPHLGEAPAAPAPRLAPRVALGARRLGDVPDRGGGLSLAGRPRGQ